MNRRLYNKTDIVNFFTIEKFVMFNEYKVDFPLPYIVMVSVMSNRNQYSLARTDNN